MNPHIKDFYREFKDDPVAGKFHKVIPISADEKNDWTEIHEKVPELPRGWFELAHLTASDRVEFTRDFWIAKLPFHAKLEEFLIKFFQSVENIYLFLVQEKRDEPFFAHLVYNLKNDAGFFKAHPPILDADLLKLQANFPEVIFPKDYVAFLQIHDGFCKTTDCTGIFNSKSLKPTYERFQADLIKLGKEVTNTKGEVVDPKSLIPFYKSFGMPFYQCFYQDWYPEEEMGNVYYAGNSNTISDVKNKDPSSEAMAFATFSDWLIFYLETIS